MLDIKFIRENPSVVKENLKKKSQDDKIPLVDQLIKLDELWRNVKKEADELRHERNTASEKVNEARKKGQDISQIVKKIKEIPIKIAELEEKEKSMDKEIKSILLQLPNIISKHTPKGKDASENKEIKKGGKIPKFTFPIKTHVEILEKLGLVDFDASAKVSGNGFYYLKDDLGLLNQALIRFGIDFMKSKGYHYIEPPLMLHDKEIFASMNRAAIEQSVYSIRDEDLNLIGTSEQAILAMHSGQAIDESQLPRKYFSYSMCFRKEVGAHGINEKGLWRTHQFNKIEQFIFCKPKDSEKLYDELLKNSEEILKKLELPYRVIEICTGDLADWKYRSADLEVYRPTIKEYGEVMSLSNCTDYQARKLDIKYVTKEGERIVLHTLNDTALATSRILVTIIENNQQKDGSIKIPKVLQKYMGNQKFIGLPK
ncbi:MAG: serine--tRNA ligase, partial [Candidatus Nanoarchaeia archaeon]|nr:serine--tRNA ligase [Candidatus Nanoarchaeia archaeon]